MRHHPIALLLCLALASTAAAQQAEPQGEPVPEKVFKAIEVKLKPPVLVEATPDQRLEAYRIQLHEALKIGLQAEKDYPNAPNLHELRLQMYTISDAMSQQLQDPNAHKIKLAVAERIVESNAPLIHRYQADVILLTDKIASMPAQQIRAELMQFMARYLQSEVEVRAKLLCLLLAGENNVDALQKNLVKNLKDRHLDSPGVRAVLRAVGEHPDEGQLLKAQLTTLDGKTLRLPDDLKGKVVVLDFWATWIPDAEQFAQELKKLEKTFAGKDVVIVGISLDKAADKALVARFARENLCTWTQTFSGKYIDDPLAVKTGLIAADLNVVNPVPNRWVIGKDGRVVSDAASGTQGEPDRLETIVRKALEGPEAPEPAAPAEKRS